MNRPILVCALLVAATASLGAQEASQAAQSNPYQGTSNPPADDQIITSTTPPPKPPAGQPMASPQASSAPAPPPDQAQPTPQQEPQLQQRPGWADSAANPPAPGNDDGIVGAETNSSAQLQRAYADDPDGDIVHPHALPRGEMLEGTTIRVRLLQRLSTVSSEEGDLFRTEVASDVLQNGQVVIPAGAEIDGTVSRVSTGHTGGHGSIRLVPETVILPNGERLRLHAEVSGTPGSKTQVNGEGTITPDSRLRRDEVEYGGAVGAGVVTGAILGGPVGAAAGGLIGAGAITVHLLVSHPQATLDQGTIMILTLTEPLDLIPGPPSQH